MKTPALSLLALSALALPAPAVPPPAAEPAPAAETAAEPAPGPLAVVDGTEITEADVRRTLHTRYGPQFAALPPERREQVIRQSMAPLGQELIVRQLLLDAANAAKVEADPEELKTTVDGVKTTLPPGLSFEDWLKQIGHTAASLSAEIADELKINAHVMARLETLPDVAEAEVKKYYEDNQDAFVLPEDRVQASHILVKTDPAAGEEGKQAKRAEIEKLREQLLAETDAPDFAKLATDHSDCPSSAQGGDLGAFGKGQMVPAFEKAAFSQEIGKVGEVIETQFGYHLILVTAKVPAGLQPLEVVRGQITAQLEQTRQRDSVRSYIEELEEGAEITRSKALQAPEPQPFPQPAPEPEPAE